MGNIGTIEITPFVAIKIKSEGNFKIGISKGGESIIDSLGVTKDINYYVGTFDLFSLFVTPQVSLNINENFGLSARFGINVFNLGATMAFLEKGTFKDDAFGSINIIPFSFFPSVSLDFGKLSLGIGFIYNPYNILEYRIGANGIFGNGEKGIGFSEATIKRTSLMITLKFQK